MNIALKTLSYEHLDELYLIKNNAAVLNDIPGEYPLERDLFDENNGKIINAGPTKPQAAFTIFVDDVIAGMTGHFCREGSVQVEVGYFIGERWWGKSIATKALLLNLQEMRNLGVSGKVVGAHASENIASGKVLKNAGFSPDGESAFTLPDGSIVMDPKWMILL